MSFIQFTDWKPDRFKKLFEQITKIFRTPTHKNLRELRTELIRNKSWFINLLDVPPKNDASRTHIRQGSIVISGQEYKLNNQYIEATIILSDALNIDEKFAATLYLHGVQCAYSNKSALHQAVLLFLSESNYLLGCLYTIISTPGQEDYDLNVRELFQAFVSELVDGFKKKTHPESFASKLMKTLASLRIDLNHLNDRQIQLNRGIQTLQGQDQRQLRQISQEQQLALRDRFIDVLQDRIKALTSQRKKLARILYTYSYNFLLETQEIFELAASLQKANLQDFVVPHLICSLLASIDITPEHVNLKTAITRFNQTRSDRDFISNFTKLISSDGWDAKEIQAVITLQWSMYAWEATKKSPALRQQLNLEDDQLTRMSEKAILDDAFQFITYYLLSFTSTNQTVEPTRRIEIDIDEEFRYFLLQQLRLLVLSFISTNMFGALKKIQTREEDAYISAGVQPQSRPPTTKKQPKMRHDVEAFFMLIAALYRDEPDEGLIMWHEHRPFLHWASGCDEQGMMRAFLEMLASLATGTRASEAADEFLLANEQAVNTWCSWKTLDVALKAYGSPLGMGVSMASRPNWQYVEEISKGEVPVLTAFARVLGQVVKYSVIARARLFKEKYLEKLFNLLSSNVSLDLKAAIFDAIAAFCEPLDDYADVIWQVWSHLERLPVFPKNDMNGRMLYGNNGTSLKRELEEKEVPNKKYPETIAFLHLISVLINIPNKRAALRSGLPVRSPTIPHSLGEPYRSRGIIPYIEFIIDSILVKALAREYAYPPEKWNVVALSLDIVEKCLICFDLTGLLYQDQFQRSLASVRGTSVNLAAILPEPIETLKQHPGYDIMKRLLCNSRLMDVIFEIISFGFEAINENKMKTPLFAQSVLHCLRILELALRKQDRFTNKLLPLTKDNVQGRLEAAFMSKPEILVQVALLLQCGHYNDICFHSVNILAILLRSNTFNAGNMVGAKINRLSAVLTRSSDSDRILSGFVDRLEWKGDDEVRDILIDREDDEIEMIIEQDAKDTYSNRMQDDEDEEEMTALLENEEGITAETVGFAILDLILESLRSNEPSPKFAHFLLGYASYGTGEPVAMYEGITTCFHVILRMLEPTVDDASENDDETRRTNSLAVTNPLLASRCYEVIYRLCSNSQTAEKTLVTLRTQYNFIFDQFKLISPHIEQPAVSYEDNSIVCRHDQAKVKIDLATLIAYIWQRTWLMKLVALELKRCPTRSNVENLLAVCFGSNAVGISDESESIPMDVVGDDTMKILELLHMLEHEWEDQYRMDNLHRRYFDRLNIDIFQEIVNKKSKKRRTVYNIRDIYSALELEKMKLRATIGSRQDWHNMCDEMKRIVRYCFFMNRRVKYVDTRQQCFFAWREVVDIVFYNMYEILRFEKREAIVQDILSHTLKVIKDEDEAIAECLSKTVVAAITTFRQTHLMQDMFQPASNNQSSSSPATVFPENFCDIFKQIIDCLLLDLTRIETRMNLYIAICTYLRYCNSEREDMSLPVLSSHSAYHNRQSLASISTSTAALTPPLTTPVRGTGIRSVVDAGNLSILRNAGERLLEIIRLDASEGQVGGQLAALTVLAVLCVVYSKEKVNIVVDFLIRSQFVANTIDELKSSDDLLKKATKSTRELPVVHATYLFESRISLLLRISQRPEYANKLIDFAIMETMKELTFLDERLPHNVSQDEDNGDRTSYEKYNSLLLMVIRLIVSILTAIGHESGSVLGKATGFVASHQGMMADIFTDFIPLSALTSNNKTARTRCIKHLEVLCEVTALFYYLGSKIDSVDKARTGHHQPTFHNLMRELISRFFTYNRNNIMIDIDDEEHLQQADRLIALINRNLISWAQKVTDFKANEFKPLFTASLKAAQRPAEHHIETREPELSVLVVYLRLSVSKVFDELQKSGDAVSGTLNQCLSNVEMAILILWRHLDYYLSPRTATTPGSSFPVTRPSLSLYNRRDPVTEQLKAASRDVLLPMMDDMSERFTSELVEKKSAAVSGFWKRIDEERKQREEEKAAVRTASLGHLNIIGRALTTYEPRIRRNLVTQYSDDVLGVQNNQEEVEVSRDVERESKTNGSLVSSVVMREVSTSFLPKQLRDEEAEVLSASITKNIMSPPRPTYNISRPSPVVRGKRKLRNLLEDRPNLRIRLHECESSDSEHEEDDDGEDFSSGSDDDDNDIGIDFDSNIFTENNEKGGWMLETGEKIVNVLSSMTSNAMEQVKHSEKRDACALSVIRLGLSSIIDLSSEFPGGMCEWFGEHWSALKARALEHLNITIRKFEDPLTTDIKKIMECCTSYQYYEARDFILGRMSDQSTECLYHQVMTCYLIVLDMFLRDPHVFVSKEGKKQNLSETDYIVKIIGPILDIIFSDVQQLLQLKWGNRVCKGTRRKIDLRIICREKDIELSHSECARMITRIKIIKDRSKSLRTNKHVLDNYLINNLSEEAVEDSVVIGLQFAEFYGQIIGIDLLDEGLYFGFEGPTFAFPNQLCNLSSLQETLEALYFLKDNVVRKARALFPHGNAPNPFHDILHKGVRNSKPHHRKIDFMRATYFTPQSLTR